MAHAQLDKVPLCGSGGHSGEKNGTIYANYLELLTTLV
jgi:hypothetical protein